MINKLLAKYGYYKRDWGGAPVDKKDIDAQARAHRWIAFHDEQGGIGDMLRHIDKVYFDKAAELAPGDIEGLKALSMASQIARQIHSHVKQIIDSGLIERSNQEHADRIAALPEAQRRRL